jgi:hypothetical protein
MAKKPKPIPDISASRALNTGQLDIVVRYLREVAAPAVALRDRHRGIIHGTATIQKIADMLEQLPTSEQYLKRVRHRPGATSNEVDTLLKTIEIGRLIQGHLRQQLMDELKRLEKICQTKICQTKIILKPPKLSLAIDHIYKELKIGRTRARQAYKVYQEYCEHDARLEPMPIPDRSSRRRSRARSANS